ncbi:APC family permease [Candidatus Epulonipiscium viviparus]|uniref:APC family permease n=1 Tax=Candidatus Epulonipiscium viviparus TaxID=420336 RepID=UPI000494F9ED|nr:amino acid permease [Candidatus Epulopiscium viviparus]
MKQKEYGLFTAITMIVGIVIGSGIFFKSDDILNYTGGSVSLGILVFAFAAISIVFGSLTIGELAARNSKSGGIITYAEEFSKPVACAIGWFQVFLYYPTITAVVAWVAGIYTCLLFGFDMTLMNQTVIGAIYIVFLFVINILSKKFGGYLQNGSTIIKLIPLIFFAICGLTMGDPGATLTSTNVKTVGTASVLAALAPIAFSFDGWIVTSAIGAEVKNSKRNLPIAFVVGPLIVLAVYIVYFVGISTLIGPQNVIALGDAHVDVAANSLIGPMGAKIVLIFVIISVIGTVNGLILGGIRLPQSLAARNMFPFANKIKIISEQYGVSIRSAIVFFVVVMFWLVIHFITQKFALLTSGDVSEISIALSYGLYIYLYIHVILLAKSGEIKSKVKGYVIPGLAIFGACIILSSVFSNSLFFVHFSICLTIILAAMLYYTEIAVHREGDQEKKVA